MRKAQKGAQTKTSLKELLERHPGPQRNDWSNGRLPLGTAAANENDGFPEYDPKAFESGSEEDYSGVSAGGSYAVLAALKDDASGDDGDWVVATSKNKKKAGSSEATVGSSTAAPGAALTSRAAAAARGAAPAAHTAFTSMRPPPHPPAAAPAPPRSAAVISAALSGVAAGSGGAGTSNQRAPYTLTPAQPPRPQRFQTHDAEGKPLSDTYYQSFQKVYRNEHGAVCLRFHKTDVVMVEKNGKVVLTSGGYKTRTTFRSVSEGLQALGLRLTSSLGQDGRGDWFVVLPDGSHLAWEDGMEIPAVTLEEQRRGERLLAINSAAGGGGGGSVAASDGRRAGAMDAGRAVPSTSGTRGPRPAPAPAPGPAPAAWSYRAAAGVAGSAAYPPPPYAPHLGPPGATASTHAYAPVPQPASGPSTSGLASTFLTPPAPAPAPANPTPRTAASADELAAVLNEALALQGGGEEVDDEFACIACMAAPKNTILIPCGHVVLCRVCAETVMERTRECPMCRRPLVTHLELSE